MVSAGEILEHVADPSTVVAEACRLLRPGGTLVLDTINATALGPLRRRDRWLSASRAAAPKGIHDPALFVPPALAGATSAPGTACALTVRGIRPAARPAAALAGDPPRATCAIVPTRSTAVLYQGWGVKEG